jgi:hypothetical protein
MTEVFEPLSRTGHNPREVRPVRASDRTLRALAWGIFAFSVAVAGAGIAIAARSGPAPLPGFLGTSTDRVTALVLELLFPLVGAVIVSHRPRNLVGWLLLIPGALASLANLTLIYAVQALVIDPGSLPFGSVAAWGETWFWLTILPLLLVLLLVYPSGGFLSPRWRGLAWGCVLGGIAAGAAVAIIAWPYRGRELLVSRDVLPELQTARAVTLVFFSLALAAMAFALASLVLRYRKGKREERLQIKWLATAVALLMLDSVLNELFPIEATWRAVLANVVFVTIPIAIGIAVLKYRLYEIEVIINRTLVHVPLLAIIGGLATAMIPLSQRMFMAVTGSTSDAAIVLTTLFVASLVTPVRKRLETAVEGRFKAEPTEAKTRPSGNGPDMLVEREVAAQLRSLADRIVALERRQSGPSREGP